MLAQNRINLMKAALAVLALVALANRFWLHWCSITPADLIAGVLVAATVAARGLSASVKLSLIVVWGAFEVLCAVEMFVFRQFDHIGVEVVMALGFSAVLASAAEQELTAALPPVPSPARGLAVFRTNGRIERRRPPLVIAIDLPASKALAAL